MAIRATRLTRRIWVALIVSLAMISLAACRSGGRVEGAAARPPAASLPLPALAEERLSAGASSAGADLEPTSSMTLQPVSGQKPLFGRPGRLGASPGPNDLRRTVIPTLVPAQSPPVRLVIASIHLDAPIVPIGWQEVPGSGKSAWDDPGSAVGWLRTSALPGRGSNVVLAGHHNIRGEVFRRLIDTRISDCVYLIGGETVYCYQVRERFIVPEEYASPEQREQNALWIAPTIDERLTLVTCWPYRYNSHRLIIVAKPDPDALAECGPSAPRLGSLQR